MRVRVLGSAAGGGFPQWNCGCPNCRGVREGRIRAAPRLSESVAVSADGARWVLLNASPDVAQQIAATPALQPRALRDTPIVAVVLTNGDVDHCLGLLVLRESQPLAVYATTAVRDGFLANPLARTLARSPAHVAWRSLPLGAEVDVAGSGLLATAVAVPGKPPLHLDGRVTPGAQDNVGLRLRVRGASRVLAYFPGVARVTEEVLAALADAHCVLFDGTFWTSDELTALGIAARPAEAMGHVPVSGPCGSLAALARLPARRRLYVHVNNTNPLLREDSPERAAVHAAGVEVAHDGLELDLM
jgi:pyrroloquinoline quinone biosynthesis protein B